MVSGMAQRRGHCDITGEASLPPDGARGVSFGATAVMEVDTLHGAPDPGSAHNMGNILPKSQGRTKGPVASHAPHRAPMTEGLLLPVEEAPTEWCAGGSPRSGGVLQRLWNENASVLIGLSLMKECRVQLPTRAAPKGDVTMVKHHVSIMLPRLAFVAAHTTHSLLFAWAWDPNLLPWVPQECVVGTLSESAYSPGRKVVAKFLDRMVPTMHHQLVCTRPDGTCVHQLVEYLPVDLLFADDRVGEARHLQVHLCACG